ncbi:MAG: lipocalin family protein, partial [Chloroflexi bacterium]
YAGLTGTDSNERLLPPNALHVRILNHWTSQATGAIYPSGWQIEINDPRLYTSLTLTPELQNQELVVYQSTGNAYWEGAVTIRGHSAGTQVQGEGYVELTGYAH